MSKVYPPVALKKPKKLTTHDHERIDNYFWMRERENPEVINHLEKENAYLEQELSHTEQFQESLFQEMKARIKEDDESVPYKFNGYWYITRFEKGKNYPIYTRKKETLEAQEELLFDCNEMAEGHDFFKLVGLSVSPDNSKIAFGLDTVGRRKYDIYIKDLHTNTILEESLKLTTGSASWANDNKTLFYTRKDEQTLRSDCIFKHKLGSSPEEDAVVYTENDETFNTYVYKTKSRKYIVIGCFSTLSNEYRILNADNPDGDFKLFTKRDPLMEHEIYHYDDHFYILTNKDNATNFKLMKAHELTTEEKHWEELIPHRRDVLVEGVDIFKDYLVLDEREKGLEKIKIIPWNNPDQAYYLPFDNETYTVGTGANPDFDTEVLRYHYTSMTTPASVMQFNMNTKEKKVLKVSEIADGSYNEDDFTSERIWAIADDGKEIPISLVYKKGLKKDGKNPLLLYAYGSYGATISAGFSKNRISLLNRGFVFAIAHVRGGEYLGRPWYEDGKLFNKKNTFNDFIRCSEFLIEKEYTSPKHHYALGGSAGGLLIGAVINQAPKLYKGVIAAVPFVDVVTTMLDESIPLTTGEFNEWGNPKNKLAYDYMLSYSPYDQVKGQAYPTILVTSGLHDSQVQYWEPTKWVAKLRTHKKNDNKVLLKTNMNAGHGGASGRFEALKEVALEYAFLLDLEGINT